MEANPWYRQKPEVAESTANAPQGPVAWILTREDLIEMIEALRNSVVNVMDLETTGLDEHAVTGGKSNGGVAARVSIASLTLPQKDREGNWDGEEPTTYLVPLSHPRSPFLGEWHKVLRFIARAMVKYRTPFVNQHTKFDARWIYARTGINLADLIAWDTQIIAHLLDDTESTKLKEMVPRIFKVPRWDDHDLSYPGASEEVEFWELGEYAARDTYWTWRLYLYQLQTLFLDPLDPFAEPIGEDEVAEARLGRVATYVSLPTSRALCHLEQQGIRLDIPYTEELLQTRLDESRRGLDWLAERFDLPRDRASSATASGWFQDLTKRAIGEGELRVVSMTKAGNAQWTKHILKKQARTSETAQKILEQRNAETQSQFLHSWLEKVSPAGYIHSSYRAGHVATGRLSSAGPNMQQVSKELRKAFIPSDGYFLADLDYSQLELRVAAFISRCEPMIEAFKAGQDLHRLFAADLMSRRLPLGAPPVRLEDVPGEERQKAKSGNFGLLYLQTAEGFRNYADAVYGVEMTEQEAHEVYEGFFLTWEGMHEWHQRSIKEAAGRGYALSPIGRRRILPNLMDGNEYFRAEAERQAVNAPVQGFGSDLMQMALASIYGEMPDSKPVRGVRPVATVHDSLVAEVKIIDYENIVEQCQERMTNLDQWLLPMGVDLDVPLAADAIVGTRWGLDDIMSE